MVIGIRTVGVVLMSAMLITLATIARFWMAHISYNLLVAMLIAVFSSVAETFVSNIIPFMPTGLLIVHIMSIIANFSFLISCYCRISKKTINILYDYKTKEVLDKTYILDLVRKQYVLLTAEEWVRQHMLHYLIHHCSYPKGLSCLEKRTYGGARYYRPDIILCDKFSVAKMVIKGESTLYLTDK